MLDKPPLADECITAGLRAHYALTVADLEFLPVGYDFNAGVYRLTAADGRVYFLKVRRGAVAEYTLAVPHDLRARGIDAVVAPLPTQDGSLWATVDDFTLILYPFVTAEAGMDAGVTDQQWRALGAILRQIHDVDVCTPVYVPVPRENFVPYARTLDIVKRVHATIHTQAYADPVAAELAAFWREHYAEIDQLIARTEALSAQLQGRTYTGVLCHADFHMANILVGADGALFIVDWDQPIIAPKERDLMFIVNGRVCYTVTKRLEALFFAGYGEAEIDWPALAYYHYERIVQDLGEFADHILLMDDVSAEAKRSDLYWFRSQFAPDGVLEAAHGVARRVFDSA